MKKHVNIQVDESTVPSYAVHDHEKILGFFGPYRWASNFYPAHVYYEGFHYPTSEHAYQAAKTKDIYQRMPFTFAAKSLFDHGILTAGQAKRMARKLDLRKDWEQVKTDIMMAIVFDKFFRNMDLREKLLATSERYLEETNSWGDTCWGRVNGIGENRLGKILMRVRGIWQPL